MAADAPATEFAAAKLNLFLEVTGRRADGYHELDSLVVFADIGDTVSAAPADTLSLDADGPFADRLPAAADNLVMRAAAALRAAFDIDAGAALHLTKRLPAASGIGGGSADAAAAIRACATLWGIDRTDPKVAEIALGLGADVPVCLAGAPCLMRGIGEDLTPVAHVPALTGVLVNPDTATATPAVFAARTGGFSEAQDWVDRPCEAADFIAAVADRRNDLQGAAMTVSPAIGHVLETLDALPGVTLARMSGSGATCFALFAGTDVRDSAVGKLAAAYPDWWVEGFRVGP